MAFHVMASFLAIAILVYSFQPVIKNANPRDTFGETLVNGLFDNSIHSIVGEKGTGAATHRQFQKQFGSDEFIQLVISSAGTLDTDAIDKITQFVANMERPENGAQVVWIGKLPHAPDSLKFNQPLASNEEHAQFNDFIARIKTDPLAGRLMRFANHRWDMALYVIPEGKLKNDGDRARFTKLVRTTWEKTQPPSEWHTVIVGTPKILTALRQALIDAVTINFPLVNFLVIALCWLVARQMYLVLVFFLPLLQSELWMVAAYLGSGYGFNYITGNMATVIMVIGAATSIHLLSAWIHARNESNSDGATREAYRLISRPCLVATTTTMIALMSLGFSSDPAIRHFGLFSTFGLAATLLCAFTLSPALLALWSPRKTAAYRPDRLSAPLLPLPFWAWNNPVKVLTIALLIGGLGAIGLANLKAGTHIHGYFTKHSNYSKAVKFAEQRFPGYIPYELIVSWPEAATQDDSERAAHILKLARQIKATIVAQSDTRYPIFSDREVLSLDDFLSSFCLDPSKSAICPNGTASPELASYFVATGLGTDISPYIIKDAGRNVLRTTVFHNPGYASDDLEMMRRLQYMIKTQVDNEASVEVTGISTMWVYHDATIISSLVNSFVTATVIILLMMALFYRELKPLLISIPSNILPLIVSLGVAGIYCALFSAKLTSAALMFTTVGVGIIVDDTLYFMLTYQRHIKSGVDGPSALQKTMSSVGPGIVLTAICLSVGTSTLLVGELIPMKVFGGLLSLTVVIALFSDLLLLPALCKLFWNPVR